MHNKHPSHGFIDRSVFREPIALTSDEHRDIQDLIVDSAALLTTSDRQPTKTFSSYTLKAEEAKASRAYRQPQPFAVEISSDYLSSKSKRVFGLRTLLTPRKGRSIDAEITNFPGKVPAHMVKLLVKNDDVDEGYEPRRIKFDALTSHLASLLHEPSLADIGHIRTDQTFGEALVQLPSRLDSAAQLSERREVYRAGSFICCNDTALYFSERGTRLEIKDSEATGGQELWLAAVASVDVDGGRVGQQLTYRFKPDDPTSQPIAYMDLMSTSLNVEQLSELSQPSRGAAGDIVLGALKLLLNPQY